MQATFRARAPSPAVMKQERTFTYGALDTQARQAAAWLQGQGVEHGDRVVLCTSNKLAFLLAHLSTLYAGAVSLPLNPRFTREELRFFLSDSGARIAVVDDETRSLVTSLQPELPELRAIVTDTEISFSVRWQSANAKQIQPELAADDPCLIIYSSGTTGWPKGVVHTHGNVASSLLALQKCWRLTPSDVVLNVLPLFHVHGLCFATQM